MGADFTLDQKRWLEGFASGAAAIRGLAGTAPAGAPAPAEPTGPDAAQLKAQDRTASAGKKLVDQEKWKRAEHPMDAYERLKTEALGGAKPKPEDNFRWRYHGLFYVAPAQDSYMCRLRIPNGILTHWQFAAVADIAEARRRLHARDDARQPPDPRDPARRTAPPWSKGWRTSASSPRARARTTSATSPARPTAGIDPHELLDTRPHARAWHHHILNNRDDVWAAPKIQRRLRRRRRGPHAGGHQRHRLPGGRDCGGRAGRARRVVSASRSAASPATRTLRATPA